MSDRGCISCAGAPLVRAASRWSCLARSTAARVALLGALLCGAPLEARAETAVLLSARGDAALEAEQGSAHAELRAALADQGVRVVDQADVVADAAGPGCDSVDCAPELLRSADADIAAAIAVWNDASRDDQQTVFVTLVDNTGARFPGQAEVGDAGVQMATRDALLDARALQLLGPGPWLRVTSHADDAQVLIDGELVGGAPYRAPVTPGRHTLEVRAEGYRPHVQSVDIPPNAARQVEVEAELEPRPGVRPAVADDDVSYEDGFEEGRSTGSVVGPLVLGVAGAAVLAADVALVLSTGCERRHEPSGVCLESRETDTGMAIAWGAVGVGAITGAILWYVLDVPEGAERGDLSLRLGPTGIDVTGSF